MSYRYDYGGVEGDQKEIGVEMPDLEEDFSEQARLPTCPHCGTLVRRFTIRGRNQWTCSQHDAVQPRWVADSEVGFRGVAECPAPSQSIVRERPRGLRLNDIQAVIRIPKTARPRYEAPLLPRGGSSRPD